MSEAAENEEEQKKKQESSSVDSDADTVLDGKKDDSASTAPTVHTQPLDDASHFSSVDAQAATRISDRIDKVDPEAATQISDRITPGTRSTMMMDSRMTPATRRSSTQELELAKIPPLPGYRYTNFLGRGGMGVVIQATDTRLERDVAIKLPLPQFLDDHQFRERFLREARSVAALRHPNICPIYDFGEHGEQLYLVLPYIDGGTLEDWLDKKPDARQKAEMLATIADAVAAAHAADIVHRDLKPINIQVERKTGAPVLMDFGLAKQTADDNASLLTQDGQVVGTPAYMAPEQARGSRDVGPAADIYSLGAILYEMLTEQRPYSGGMRQVLLDLEAGPPPRPKKVKPSIHSDLETICMKAMERSPHDRYVSAKDLAADLRRFAIGESIVAKRAGTFKRSYNFAKRHKLSVSLACIACICAIAGIVWLANETDRITQINEKQNTLIEIPDKVLLQAAGRDQALTLIAELKQLDSKIAKKAQDRHFERMEEIFKDALSKPRIDDDFYQQLKTMVSDIKNYDQNVADILLKELNERREQWDTVAQLHVEDEHWHKIEGQWYSVNKSVGVQHIPTPLRSDRPLEIQATWPRRQETGKCGLALIQKNQKIYSVQVRFQSDQVINGDFWEISLYRDNQVLASWSSRKLQGKNLHIRFRVNNGDCQVHVNGTLYQHRDLFPIKYKNIQVLVIQDTKIALSKLVLLENSGAVKPSKLEIGDELYLENKWQEAIQAYSQQAHAVENKAIKAEAEYKQAVCLYKLGNTKESEDLFSKILNSEQGEWSTLAGCQLWASMLERGAHDEAEAVAALLDLHYDRAVITANLPFSLRTRITRSYSLSSSGTKLITPQTNRVERLKNLLRVYDILSAEPRSIGYTNYALLRALFFEKRYDEAIEVAKNYVREYGHQEVKWSSHIIEELSWLLRLKGKAQEAKEFIERYQQRTPQEISHQMRFAPEYARCLLALGQHEAAKEFLDNLDPQLIADGNTYAAWAGIYCLRAELELGKNDRIAAYQQALSSTWKKMDSRSMNPFDTGFSSVFTLICAEHEANQEEINAALKKLLIQYSGKSGDGNTLNALLRNFKVDHKTLQTMWQTERGKALAHKIIFRTHDLYTCTRGPICLFVYASALQKIFPDGASADQDQLLWELITDGFDAYQQKKIDMKTMFGMAMAYKGITGSLGWGIAAERLPKHLVGPVAYVLSIHFEHLNKTSDAELLRQQAKENVGDNDILKRLLIK